MENLPLTDDETILLLAKKRVGFKNHAVVYVVINVIGWLIWLFAGEKNLEESPIWMTGGWGIGLFFNYLGAYQFNKIFSVEKEIEKIKREREA